MWLLAEVFTSLLVSVASPRFLSFPSSQYFQTQNFSTPTLQRLTTFSHLPFVMSKCQTCIRWCCIQNIYQSFPKLFLQLSAKNTSLLIKSLLSNRNLGIYFLPTRHFRCHWNSKILETWNFVSSHFLSESLFFSLLFLLQLSLFNLH